LIRPDLTDEELKSEVHALRKRVTELEAFHTEHRPDGPISQPVEAIAIIESFDDGALILDRKGRVVDVNQKLEILLGYRRRELIGKTALSTARLLTRKGLTFFLRNPFNTIADAAPASHELDVFKKGGDLVTVQIFSRQLKNDGKVVGRLVILKDTTEARRLERESSESAGVYKSLVNHVEVGIFRATPGGAGRFIQVNHAMEEITGYSRKELMQLNVEDLYAFREERLKHVNDALGGVPAKVQEIRFKKKDGSEITVREKQVAIRSTDGKALFLEGFLEDITDRKRAEEALKASEQNLHNTLDSSPLGIYIIDADLKTLYANQALLDIFGYQNIEEIRTEPLDAHYTPESQKALILRRERYLRGEPNPERFELDIVRKDGTIRHLQADRKEILWDGKKQRMVIYNDISEDKHAEEALKASEQNLRDFLDNSVFGIRIRTNGYVEYANQALLDIFGYKDIEELRANPPETKYTPKCRIEFLERKDKISRGEPVANPIEVEAVRKDGSIRHLQVFGRQVIQNGKVQAQTFFNDISDRKQAETALQESEEKYRALFENAAEGIVVVQDGLVKLVNRQLIEMTGYKHEEIYNKSFTEFIHPGDIALVSELYQKWIHGEIGSKQYPLRFLNKAGKTLWFQVKGSPITWDNKTATLNMLTDITEQKEAEAALKASEENFRNSMDSSVMGISIMGENNYTLYANQTLLDMFDYKNIDELRSSPPQEHYTPESYAGFVKRREQFARGELLPSQLEIDITRKDSAIRHLELLSKIVLWNGEQHYQFIYNDITDRVEAEKAVKASQETYSTLIEQNADGIVMLNKHSIEFANRKMSELFGFSSDEILGKEFVDLVSPSYKDKLIKSYVRELPVGVPNTLELEMVTKDGKGITVDTRALPIIFKDRPATMVVIRDITEQKVAEAAAKASELNFRNSLDSSSMGIRISDNQENNLYVNQAMLNIFGYRNIDEIKGDPPSNHYAPQDYAEWILRHEKFLRGEPMPKHIEAEIKDKNGIIKNLDISMTEVFWDGRIQFETIYNDVTERKQAEAKLERAAKEWRTTFDSISDLIMIHDNDHRIIRANKAAADWMKTTPKELVGKLCCEVFRGNKEPQANCPCASALKTGKPVGFENYNPSLGTYLYESHSPLFNDQGEAIGSILVARDITEQKRMEEQLILTDRLASIGELSSGIAHELNNPLTSVIGFSQLIMDGDVPENIKENLSIVNSEAQRAAGIIKNLLTFARKHTPVTELSQINNIMEDVLRLRAYEQKVNNIEVEKYLAADLPEIMMDHFQMQQVFLNIIVNAEFSMIEAHKRGKLTVSSEKSDGGIRVRITDDGPGISRENLKHIFDPFFTTKEVGKGTGLGLSICHGIVLEHGGQIFATSHLGQGTIFTVELPLTGETNEKSE